MTSARPQPLVVRPHLSGSVSPEHVREGASDLPLESIAAWASLPYVAYRMSYREPGDAPSRPGGTSRRLWAARARNLRRPFAAGRGPALHRTGPVLTVSTGVQTDRVLDAISRGLEPRYGRRMPVQLPRLTTKAGERALRDGYRVARMIGAWCAQLHLPTPVDMEEEVVKSAICAERVLAADLRGMGIAVVVAATQHNSTTRAVLAAAAETGIATCYIPHAPVADNPFYRDLPVHFALLRGDAEVEYYSELGVQSAGRMYVVGQPGVTMGDRSAVATADHVIFAATDTVTALRSDAEVIAAALDRPVEVCLHPRTPPGRDLSLPPDWTVHPPGPTMRILRQRGAYALIQHGSGVGLEAMKAGVDVIDLCPIGERPNYPYIAAPHIQIASDSESLRSALAAVPERRARSGARLRYASRWTAAFDPEAGLAAAEALSAIIESDVPRSLLLDGWRPR